MKLRALLELRNSKDFELLWLNAPINDDILKAMLEDQDLSLTFNGNLIDSNSEDFMALFRGSIRNHLGNYAPLEEINENPAGLFVRFQRMGYDIQNQCLYFEEIYSLKNPSPLTSSRTVMIYERIAAQGMSCTIKFLTKARFDTLYSEREHELVDLRTVLGIKT